MTVWRLCKARWKDSAFTGLGAAENPGRWNSAGTRVVYCGESRALCALETIANAGEQRDLAKARFVAFQVEIPDALIERPVRVPGEWRKTPPGPATRAVGDRFVREGRLPALRVPSAVVPGEFAYLLNPTHPQFSRLTIGPPQPFRFDPRVLSVP
jgi:RES domain-containing protein